MSPATPETAREPRADADVIREQVAVALRVHEAALVVEADAGWEVFEDKAAGFIAALRGMDPPVYLSVRAVQHGAGSGEAAGLREALQDLLWWHEWMQREDRFRADLADTEEEAERRHQLWQTFMDHDKTAEWLRALLAAPVPAAPTGAEE